MSSHDRSRRSNRSRPEPDPFASYPDDDLVAGDQWGIDSGGDNRPRGEEQPTGRRSAPSRGSEETFAPSADGTAAQLDQLRRNIRQSSRPAAPTPAPGIQRSTAPPLRRRETVVDDQVVSDIPFFDDDDEYLTPAKSRSNPVRERHAVSSQQPQSARPTRIDDDRLNEDPYVDYDEFDDGFSDYDVPRPPERRPRPRPQLTMPSITRPTLPPAIAKADLMNDAPALGIIGAGLASLAAMAIVVANQAESLAPEFATHVSASGILENFRDESALWNLPLMAAMFTLMNIVMAWFISPLDRFASRFVLVGALVAQFLAWVAIIRIL